ncbi:MAG: aminopeptidase P family protein [Varibaculum sp.]|nr:aminopeptidase P family protein [Varibaculum sp.]
MQTRSRTPGKQQRNEDDRTPRERSVVFKTFMTKGWADTPVPGITRSGAADWLPARYARLASQYPGQRLVIPAGNLKTRNNDCDYRFRAHSAFAHLTGLGGEREPDAVVVIDTDREGSSGSATLFFTPRAGHETSEYYEDARYGEFWVGPRPTLADMQLLTGINSADIATLSDALHAPLTGTDTAPEAFQLIRGIDSAIDELVDETCVELGINIPDNDLDRATSVMRMTKDAFEIDQLQTAVDATRLGFERIIAELPRAAAAETRGERIVEGAFFTQARESGNGLGYDTIAASGNHANTLHWIDNDGPVRSGDLILVDAGMEAESLYTADITRTLPVNGHFSEMQARVYQAVLDACEAGLAAANQPGALFRDVHEAAVRVLVENLHTWGLLPVSVEEALDPQLGGHYMRWMPHGTSHHLGLDVHDCARAKRELYRDGKLTPGMCFTIEPGLYFKADDLLIPPEYRGIGVRIEDDVVIDPDGSCRRLSEDIPRTIAEVESWIARVQRQE